MPTRTDLPDRRVSVNRGPSTRNTAPRPSAPTRTREHASTQARKHSSARKSPSALAPARGTPGSAFLPLHCCWCSSSLPRRRAPPPPPATEPRRPPLGVDSGGGRGGAVCGRGTRFRDGAGAARRRRIFQFAARPRRARWIRLVYRVCVKWSIETDTPSSSSTQSETETGTSARSSGSQ